MEKLKIIKNYKRQQKLKNKISIKPKRFNEFVRIFIKLSVIFIIMFSIVTVAVLKYFKEELESSITYDFFQGISIDENSSYETRSYETNFNASEIARISSNSLTSFAIENSYYHDLVDFSNKLAKRDMHDVGCVMFVTEENELVDCHLRYHIWVEDKEQNIKNSYLVYNGEKYSLNEKMSNIVDGLEFNQRAEIIEGYIKGEFVFPTKISVNEDENHPTYEEAKKLPEVGFNATSNLVVYDETYFDYPENCFDGCKKISYDGSRHMYIIRICTASPEERSVKLYKNNLDTVKANTNDYKKTEETFYKKDIIISEESVIEGKNYKFVWFYSLNVWDDLYPVFIFVYILVLIIVIILSFIISTSIYNKLNTAYTLEKYRIQTINAMAHDLKSPLMAISSCAENIRNNKNSDKDKEYAKDMLDCIEHMNKMVSNIEDLSKLESNIADLKIEEVNIEEILDIVLSRYEKAFSENDLIVNTNGSLKIKADKDKMVQLFDNIIQNVSKYAVEGSAVEINLSQKKISISNKYNFVIKKSGQELLEPFVKGDNARTDTNGNGFGLSIVKTIADAHGFFVDISTDNNYFCVTILI